jgi:hypothetical protein
MVTKRLWEMGDIVDVIETLEAQGENSNKLEARPCGRISENIGQGIPKSLFR